MYSPIHASAGLLLAQLAPNPVVAFGLGVASHYVLDHLPHGDTHVGGWFIARPKLRLPLTEVFDLGGTALLTWWLISRLHAPHTATLLAGAVGGITPDILWGTKYISDSLTWLPAWIKRFLAWHARWHQAAHTQSQEDIPFMAGMSVQVVLVVALMLLYR